MKFIIPEIKAHGLNRLGRNFNHDPRSLLYKVQPATVDKSAEWERKVPIFDQGNLGSCTGNAEVGLLGTLPFFPTLTKAQQDSINEALAVKIYSDATHIDPYSGEYPPEDTGSDGLSVSKAAKALGYIKGYVWATSVSEAQTLIQQGPFIIGTLWTSNMDKPNSAGVITNPQSGSVRGGHEYECWKRDAEADLWWFFNSWGDSWGYRGMFAYNSAGLDALLQRGGDITQSVALDKPPPEPTPTPDNDPDVVAWWPLVKPWATPFATHPASHHSHADIAARACLDLAKKKGL
jgi:hypothetical protein